MPKWVKQKNPQSNFPIHTAPKINRIVSYENTEEIRRIRRFTIREYTNGDFQIILDFDRKNSLYKFLAICSSDVETLFASVSLGSNGSLTSFPTSDKALLAEFMHTLHKLDALDQTTKQKISSSLGIHLSYDKEELLTMAAEGVETFETILAKAQLSDIPDALLALGEFFDKNELKGDVQKALDCYQAIPPNNPHYKTANRLIYEIIIKLLAANERSELDEPLSDEEIKNYKLQLFDCMLKAADADNQPSIDQWFHQLSGKQDLNPVITDVGCNVETLVQLAEQVKLKNEELKSKDEQLNSKDQQIRSLEAENAELKRQLQALQNPNVSSKPGNLAFFSTPKTEPEKVEQTEVANISPRAN